MNKPRYVWAKRETRWDVYPADPPAELLRVEQDGPCFVKLFHCAEGHKTIGGYEIQRDATDAEIAFAGLL